MDEKKVVNALNWFEIPTADLDRALKFYSAILDKEITAAEYIPGFWMAMLPYENGIGGAIVKGEGYTPSTEGTVVYLNGGDDLDVVLNKVEAAGGQVLMSKMDIGEENGYAAFFMDTEGNKVGLHSMG